MFLFLFSIFIKYNIYYKNIVMKYINLFMLLIALLVLDLLWINVILYGPFTRMIQRVQCGSPMVFRPIGGLVAYVALFVLASVFLPRTKNDFEAFLMGSMIYAVYDGTNFATLTNWDARVAIADSVWGGMLFLILRRLFFSE